jgi:hypothetical protein
MVILADMVEGSRSMNERIPSGSLAAGARGIGHVEWFCALHMEREPRKKTSEKPIQDNFAEASRVV